MAKYRVIWMKPGSAPTSLGMMTFNDDEAAIAEISPLCKREGIAAAIMRPDRDLTVAVIDTNGEVQDISS